MASTSLKPQPASLANPTLAYLAVEWPWPASRSSGDGETHFEGLQSLTSRLMRWSDTIWLLDLTPCASYWEARARAAGGSAADLIRATLEASLQRLGGSLRAVFAAHPWQAALLLTHMQERRLTGVVVGPSQDARPDYSGSSQPSLRASFGDILFKDLTWEVWWECAEQLADHLKASETTKRRFDPVRFKSQCAQLRRAVKRLGLATPYHLRALPPAQIQRRFGAVLRDMGQWAYGAPVPASEALFETGFPWQSFVFTSLPSVMRHLESPLCEWSHLESLLREDFDRLCELSSWLAGERVVSLEWQIVLPDWSRLVIPIRFRHPHSLHLEKGSHATSLLQALYAFEGSRLRPAGEDGPILHDTSILGWTLVITERLRLPPRSLGLFEPTVFWVDGGKTGGRPDAQGADELALLQLENKLKVPLESFALRSDWLPEDSYARGAPVSSDDVGRPLQMLAAERPLYLYRRPIPFDPKGRSCAWRFVERTMGKWWSDQGRHLQRDYYRLTDGEHKDHWVFKDTQGQAYMHGVYA